MAKKTHRAIAAAKKHANTAPRHSNGRFKKHLSAAERRASNAKSKARLEVLRGALKEGGWKNVKKALRQHDKGR